VLVAADGAELGRAEGPGGAMRPGQSGRAAATIADTARRATFGTSITLPVPRAVVGVAGAGRAPERDELATELRTQAALAREVRVMGDVELALHAAFGAGAGIDRGGDGLRGVRASARWGPAPRGRIRLAAG
jgi:N-acetylglucosamine kinase-like BadF-type ATPase